MKSANSMCMQLVFVATLFSMAVDARADFFYQPPNSLIQSEWRSAGSVFLERIAQIMNGLAAIEGGDLASAQSEMARARESLGKARDHYSALESNIRAPRSIALEKFPPERLGSLK